MERATEIVVEKVAKKAVKTLAVKRAWDRVVGLEMEMEVGLREGLDRRR